MKVLEFKLLRQPKNNINCNACHIGFFKKKRNGGLPKNTFPDLWSGTTKLRIDFNPGVPNSSTVTVVKS